MQRFIPVTCLIILSFSCVQYQYMTINSTDSGKNEQMDFVVENDSIRLQYNFNGLNAPVNITIQNKLNQPLYVDWKRSALIVNNKAISYVPGSIPIQGAINMVTFDWTRNISSSHGTIGAVASVPGQLDFLPPQSYITKSLFGVSNQYFEGLPDSIFRKVDIELNDGTFRKAKKAVFSEPESPLQFKSYLTFIMGDSAAKTIAWQHSFYISEIYTSTLDPHNFQFINDQHGNRFYVEKATDLGITMQGIGVIGGVALVTAAAVRENSTGEK